jgi:hypothetical protein
MKRTAFWLSSFQAVLEFTCNGGFDVPNIKN